jgi:hypothetical protein
MTHRRAAALETWRKKTGWRAAAATPVEVIQLVLRR